MVLKQPASGDIPKEPASIPPNYEDVEDPHTPKSKSFLGWPNSEETSGPEVCEGPCYTSTVLQLPQRSPPCTKAAKDDESASIMNWSRFNKKFENWTIGAPLKITEKFSIDTWIEILSYVESSNDLYSLALTSRTLYNLALPHLYKSILFVRRSLYTRLQLMKSSSPSTTC